MTTVATIEARMSSRRLPGKVLLPIEGKPALAQLLERLRQARKIDDVVLATTVNPADAALVDLARGLGVRSYRGSEGDVLDRVLQAAESVHADTIVEVTGDCPLLCPEVIDRAVEIYESGAGDVVSNTWKPSYPQGVDAQVFSRRLLKEASGLTRDPAHREHVSLFFYEHPDRYRIHLFEAPPDFRAPELRFQMDYAEDLEFVRAVYAELYPKNPRFGLREILDLLRRKPELKRINDHCVEKPVR
jgi:spore coat polysaccharide biosynthesis protein SpsF